MSDKYDDDNSDLVLGWKVNKRLDPEFWMRAKPKIEDANREKDLVAIRAKTMEHHTVIIAQSGSGKSYFLGRLIEELLIKTLCRVFIIDPNSDFKKIANVNPQVWKDPSYDPEKRGGFLSDEESEKAFSGRWSKVAKVVYTMRPKKVTDKKSPQVEKKLEFDWLGISMDLLSEGLRADEANELRHCHDYVRELKQLVPLTKPKGWAATNDLLEVASNIYDETNKEGMTQNQILERIKVEFPINNEVIANLSPWDLWHARIYTGLEFFSEVWRWVRAPTSVPKDWIVKITTIVNTAYRNAARNRNFVKAEMARFYFSSAHILKSSGLLGQTNSSTGVRS